MSIHNCEKCNKQFDLDDGFLNIGEICDASENKIENYEKKNKVDFSNFWCITCGSETLREVEKC